MASYLPPSLSSIPSITHIPCQSVNVLPSSSASLSPPSPLHTPTSLLPLPYTSSSPYPSPPLDPTFSSAPSSLPDNVNLKPYSANMSKQLNRHKKNAERDIYLEPSNPQCIKIYMSPGLFRSLIIPALYDLPINEPIMFDDLFCTLTNLRKSYAKCGKILEVVDATFSWKGPSSCSIICIHAYLT